MGKRRSKSSSKDNHDALAQAKNEKKGLDIVIEEPILPLGLEVMIGIFSTSKTPILVSSGQQTPYMSAWDLGKWIIKELTQSKSKGVGSHQIDHFI